MTLQDDFDIPETGAIFTFGKSRFAENAPSKFWIKNDTLFDVACGDEHTAVITALKTQRIVRIACGRAHTIAASDKGLVFSWGFNGEGQLGTGDYNDKESPIQIMQLIGVPAQLAAGSSHSMLLTDQGEVFAWGSNGEGQIGCNLAQEFLVPTRVPINKVISLACGYYHSLALTENGKVYAWGEAKHGKLGLGSDFAQKYCVHPHPLLIGEQITMISAGFAHSIFLTVSGQILTCGLGTDGQLGQSIVITEQNDLKPVVGVDDKKFIFVNSGSNHSAAITDDGLVYTWGSGRHGKLCLGEHNFTDQWSPVLVSRLRHLIAFKVSCGGCHSMALGYRRTEDKGIPLNLMRPLEAPDKQFSPLSCNQAPPPFKRSIHPTVSNDFLNENAEATQSELDNNNEDVTTIPEKSMSSPTVIESTENNGVKSKQLEDAELNDVGYIKASRFAKFFISLRKRTPLLTSSSSVQELSSNGTSLFDEQELINAPEMKQHSSDRCIARCRSAIGPHPDYSIKNQSEDTFVTQESDKISTKQDDEKSLSETRCKLLSRACTVL